MPDLETKILARELGHLGGYGARFVAPFLPNISHKLTFDLPTDEAKVRRAASRMLRRLGHAVPELTGLAAVCGSGKANLNPTIVTVEVTTFKGGSHVVVCAVAKEGIIKQASAQKAVERFRALLEEQCAPMKTDA